MNIEEIKVECSDESLNENETNCTDGDIFANEQSGNEESVLTIKSETIEYIEVPVEPIIQPDEIKTRTPHKHGKYKTISNKKHPNEKSRTRDAAKANNSSLQLWQFLVGLLAVPHNASIIKWTGKGLEFKLVDPDEVARRWGVQKNRPTMNYEKLSRAFRYYYEKGIMQKVSGGVYVYKFVCDPQTILNLMDSLRCKFSRQDVVEYKMPNFDNLIQKPSSSKECTSNDTNEKIFK